MNRQLLALRGLAIFLVVLNHTIKLGIWHSENYSASHIDGAWGLTLLIFVQLGIFAVPIFMFISGAFMAYTAQGSNLQSSFKIALAGIKIMIWPYIIWSVLFYIVSYLLLGDSTTLLGYIKDLLVGYPNNFIPLLIFFYLVSPILIRFANRSGFLLILLFGLYQIFLLNVAFPGILGFRFPEWASYFTPPVLRNTLATWGIYLPLGLVYGLHAQKIRPVLLKYDWVVGVAAILLFTVSVFNELLSKNLDIVNQVTPVLFVFLIPLIKRESIPFYRQLEKIGKRAYGVYLMNLIVINLILILSNWIEVWLSSAQFVILWILVILTLGIPVFIMKFVERIPKFSVYRYLFG